VSSCRIAYSNGIAPADQVLTFAAGTANPFHACQVCDPTVSAHAWSTAPDGTPCGRGQGTCVKGTCSAGDADGASCSAAADCKSGYCAYYDVTQQGYCSGSAGQPNQSCNIETVRCAYGLVCVPLTACDPAQGSVCVPGLVNRCL
jgi:hypothetical protein